MAGSKILYVCQEITPYLPPTEMASQCRLLSQAMQEKGNEIRTFMPRYGVINERRNQLHEVIRLSGMNLIIDDNDHQLIIKVASIPSARVQIYFIDNDDYFSRKAMLTDEETGAMFADNDERAMFFARGVLETVRKLRWGPTIVHCHGWFSSMIPLYLRDVFSDDPLLNDVKIVISLYDDGFEGSLDAGLKEKMEGEGVDGATMGVIDDPTYRNLMKLTLGMADGVVIRTQSLDAELEKFIRSSDIKVMEWQDASTADYLDNYQKFYDSLA